MSTKNTRRLLLSLGLVVLVLTLINLGFNLFLKYNLPTYIKNNSAYSLSYESLDVELASGSILIKDLIIDSKNPNNKDVIGLKGTVKTVSISQLGLWKIATGGAIRATDLNLIAPKLLISLARPTDSTTGKKRSPMPFRNIKIEEGQLKLIKHTGEKFLEIENLQLEVSNLRLSEKGIENQLPVVFDNYDIQGSNFSIQPDSLYSIRAKTITTENGKMSLKAFEILPVMNFEAFKKSFPDRPNLLSLKSKELDFTDITLKKNVFSLSKAVINDPHITLQTNETKVKLKKKPFKYILDLQDVQLNNAQITVLKPNGSSFFSAVDLDLQAQNILMDENSAKGVIPFSYKEFLIQARALKIQNKNQTLKINAAKLSPELMDLQNISLSKGSSNSQLEGTVKRLTLKLDSWAIKSSKLDLQANSLFVLGANVKVFLPQTSQSKKPEEIPGITYPLRVKSVTIKESNLNLTKGADVHIIKNIEGSFSNVQVTKKSVKSKIPFTLGSYSIAFSDYSSKTNSIYSFKLGPVKWNNSALTVQNLELTPRLTRAQFIARTPVEKDLYSIRVKSIAFEGEMDLLSDKQHISGTNLVLNGVEANIFRSKVPPDDLSIKPMYSALLRKIDLPLQIKRLAIQDSRLIYEEDTKKSDGPGKLVFGKLNLHLENLNSGKSQPTKIPVTIKTLFMDVSPMDVNWTLNTGSNTDEFTIEGNVSELPASSINSFVEPYLKIQTTGYINLLHFDFKGNRSVLNGNLQMKHQSLKVAILKNTGEKDKVLSAVANLFVNSNSGVFPQTVTVDQIARDQTKSFFNFFWLGIQEGLKKTLIGSNVEKHEENAKKTLETTKQTLEVVKTDLKNTKTNLNEKIDAKKQETKEKGLRGLFRKKKKE